MVERPILFSSPMVRAVLADAKTVTRRVVTDVRGIGRVTEFKPSDTPGYDWIMRNKRMLWNDLETSELLARCPYGEHGARLWVRETWATLDTMVRTKRDRDCSVLVYRADTDGERVRVDAPWRPSIHMPRWASRLVLEVVSVRVERLREITDEDAVKEGATVRPGVRRHNRDGWSMDWSEVGKLNRFGSGDRVGQRRRLTEDDLSLESPKYAFASLWEDINGKRPGCAWEQSPWVWRVEFRRLP